MKKILILFNFALYFILNLQVFAQPYTWIETRPNEYNDNYWRATSISSDGMKMIAGETAGRLYLSLNAGITWKEAQPGGDFVRDWNISAINSDGSKIIAGTSGYATGRLYLTTDFGSSWSELQPNGNLGLQWNCVAISADGSTIAASLGDFNRLYISKDSGKTWEETNPAGNFDKYYYNHCSINSDGSVIIASNMSGRLYISYDKGNNWTETKPAGNTQLFWFTTAISSDGSRIIAGVLNGRLYISTDSGVTWTETQPNGNQNMSWYTTSMTSDGMKIIAGANNGKLYISNNGGLNWTETQPGGIVNGRWSTASINSDGSSIIAGLYDGKLFVVRPEITFPIVAITSPLGGETLPAGTTHEITWISYNIPDVKIEYTTDNGTSWLTIINSTPASSGSYLWTVPNTPSANCKIRISSTIDSSLFSISNIVFTIQTAKLYMNVPQGGENWLVLSKKYIYWNYFDVTNVKLEYSTDNGKSWLTIINSIPASNEKYLWTIPNTPSNICKIKISSNTDSSVYSISKGLFSIRAPGVLITSPNGGEKWLAFTQHQITWLNFGLSYVNLEFTTNNGASWSTIISSTPAGDGYSNDEGSYLWTVPNILSSQCKIRITDVSNSNLFSISDSAFSILPPMVWNETQPAGDTIKNWTATSMSSDGSKIIAAIGGYINGRLYISKDGGNSWNETQPTGNTNLSWQTTSMSYDGSIIIAGTIQDYFQINAGRLFISSNGGNSWNEVHPADTSVVSDIAWYTTSMNSDGSKIIAGAGSLVGGKLYISTNGGSTWNEIQPAGNNTIGLYSTSSMSMDGVKIIVGTDYPGKLFISTNGGNSWNETQPVGNETYISWTTTSTSADGSKIIAGVSKLGWNDIPENWLYDGRCFISTNGGNSWNKAQLDINNSSTTYGKIDWYKSSMSSDGKLVIAAESSGKLFISSDAGTSWIETQPSGNINESGTTIALSPDGKKLIAGYYGGRLYLNNNTISGIDNLQVLPGGYYLSNNYPNPFNPVTTINYQLPKDGQVTLKVYDILGREVAALINEFKQAGYYKVDFNGSTLSSGVYIYKLTADNFISTKKLILMK